MGTAGLLVTSGGVEVVVEVEHLTKRAAAGCAERENEDLMPIKVFSGVHVWLTILGT